MTLRRGSAFATQNDSVFKPTLQQVATFESRMIFRLWPKLAGRVHY